MTWNEQASFEFFSDQMAINFEMFGAFVEDMILNYMNSRLVVTPKSDRESNGKSKILKKENTPLNLTSNRKRKEVN